MNQEFLFLYLQRLVQNNLVVREVVLKAVRIEQFDYFDNLLNASSQKLSPS